MSAANFDAPGGDRRAFLGGSDVPKVMGYDFDTTGDIRDTALDVYLEKTAPEPIVPKDLSLPENRPLYMGHMLEEPAAVGFAQRHHVELRRVSTVTHPDFPFLRGHPDRRVVKQGALLEVKTTPRYPNPELWGEEGSGDVPPGYICQAQHYMALLPKVRRVHLTVLVQGFQARDYVIQRDDAWIEHQTAVLVEFWNVCVLQRNAPDPQSWRDMSRLWTGKAGEFAVLTPDTRDLVWLLAELSAKKAEHAAAAKELKKAMDEAKLALVKAMGDAGELLDDNGRLLCRVAKVERAAYEVKATSYVTCTLTKEGKALPARIAAEKAEAGIE